jgi:3alpha(or 20beta)-hydroxysteroid dehydrogenase
MLTQIGTDEPQQHATLQATIPLGRVAIPNEVSNMIVFLAADESSYCTGAELS